MLTSTDIDECKNNNVECSDICTNTVASHFCSCKAGFIIGSDNRTCEGNYYFYILLCYSCPWLSVDIVMWSFYIDWDI